MRTSVGSGESTSISSVRGALERLARLLCWCGRNCVGLCARIRQLLLPASSLASTQKVSLVLEMFFSWTLSSWRRRYLQGCECEREASMMSGLGGLRLALPSHHLFSPQ